MPPAIAGLALALALLAGCSSPDDPGTLSPDQQHQLNDAAAMLDANSVALDHVNDSDGNDQ